MEQWTDWVKTSGQLSSHIFSSLWTQQQIFNKTEKSNLYTYIYCLLCFFPKDETLTFDCYTWMCTFETSGVVKPHSTHSYATEVWTSRGKTRRVVQNNTVQKLEPLHASSSSQTSCTLAFAEQPSNCTSCTFVFVFVSLLLKTGHDQHQCLPRVPEGRWLVGMLWENKCWQGQTKY